MREILISIHPRWCELIALGRKFLEIRKTKPNIDGPFKCYIYQTKKRWFYPIMERLNIWKWTIVEGQGYVVGEFICDKVEALSERDLYAGMDEISPSRVEELSCVDLDELIRYKGFNDVLYAWHITDLKLYDTPKRFSECMFGPIKDPSNHLLKAPQSWCYVTTI